MKSKSSFESYEIDVDKSFKKPRTVLSVARYFKHTISIIQPEIWVIRKHIEAQPKNTICL